MELIFVRGVDLTTNQPTIMDYTSCIKARYDAGITNHDKDNTGVIEVWKISNGN